MTPFTLRHDGVPTEDERWIGGGTTLVDLMKLGVERPTALVDLESRRAELAGITETDGGLTLGALTTMAEAERDPRIRAHYPAVHLALAMAASPQIREMATLGGNLLQRTRCSYFRDGRSACNKRSPGSGCSAIGNPDETRAIIGASDHCVATYPGDLAIALVMLDATVTVKSADGSTRALKVGDLHCLPGSTPHIETTLNSGDLIMAIHLPKPDWTGQTYVKLRDRASYAFASASTAVSLHMDGATVVAARVVLGGVASVPWRCPAIEGWLTGRTFNSAVADEAGQQALHGTDHVSGNLVYRRELCARSVAKALMVAATIPRE